jgi:hypothetical protein
VGSDQRDSDQRGSDQRGSDQVIRGAVIK